MHFDFDEDQEDSLEEEINQAFALLSSVEASVLDLYFGLHDEPLSLEDVADRLGLTLREARDVKRRALELLRRGNDGQGGAAVPARVPPDSPGPLAWSQERHGSS